MPVTCPEHPSVETGLTCSRCGKPICPACMVQTPVGARCADCARLSRLPTFQVTAHHYFRAISSALGMAVVCAFIWAVVKQMVPMFSLDLLVAPVAGYAIGEVTGLAVNRKRGTWLAAIGGIAVLVSFILSFPALSVLGLWLVLPPHSFYVFSLFNILYDALAVGLGIFTCVSRLR